MNEGKKDRRDPIRTVKPRNFVAKNAGATTSGAGAHKDKKKAMKQGDVKHKNKEYAEGLQAKLNVALAEAGSLAQQAAIAINMKKHHQKPKSEDVDQDEYSDEAGMAYGSLHTISRAANGLLDTIKEGDNLPEWCQEKISLAEDYLITVWDYLQSEKEQGVAEGKWSNVIHTTDRSDEKAQREQEHKKQAGLAATVLKNHSHALDPKEIDLLTRYNLHHRGKPGVRFDRLDNEKAQQLIQNVLRFNQQGVAEGAKVDRQAKHITASMMKKGKSKKDAEAIAWAHIKHPKKKAKEGWTHDSLADQLFEHERTYEDRLQNLLNKKLGK